MNKKTSRKVAKVPEIQIIAKIDTGLAISTPNGTPLILAVVDLDGNVVASGSEVAKQVFSAACSAYDAFWQGTGHMATINTVDV